MLIRPDGLSARQEVHQLTREQMKKFVELEGFIRHLGWVPMIVCPECARSFGDMQDGVEAHNDPTSEYMSVQCGHKKYEYGRTTG